MAFFCIYFKFNLIILKLSNAGFFLQKNMRLRICQIFSITWSDRFFAFIFIFIHCKVGYTCWKALTKTTTKQKNYDRFSTNLHYCVHITRVYKSYYLFLARTYVLNSKKSQLWQTIRFCQSFQWIQLAF